MTPESEARALICLVYENDRCLLHVGVITIIGLYPTVGHIHHRGTTHLFAFQLKNKQTDSRRDTNQNLYDNRWKNRREKEIEIGTN